MIETEYQIRDWKALGSKVIVAVQITKFPPHLGKGEWAAYIGAVEGKNFEDEWQGVLANGDKLAEKIASVIFPDYAEDYNYRR